MILEVIALAIPMVVTWDGGSIVIKLQNIPLQMS
jgi:hypothetical protein